MFSRSHSLGVGEGDFSSGTSFALVFETAGARVALFLLTGLWEELLTVG